MPFDIDGFPSHTEVPYDLVPRRADAGPFVAVSYDASVGMPSNLATDPMFAHLAGGEFVVSEPDIGSSESEMTTCDAVIVLESSGIAAAARDALDMGDVDSYFDEWLEARREGRLNDAEGSFNNAWLRVLLDDYPE